MPLSRSSARAAGPRLPLPQRLEAQPEFVARPDEFEASDGWSLLRRGMVVGAASVARSSSCGRRSDPELF
jgi:hypothetical protein